MERARVWLLDSTMRDGAQGKNISFSVEDKVEILRALDRQGSPYIEAGNPSSGPKDLLFFERARQVPLEHSKLVAFGATCRKFLAPQEDRGIAALCEAGIPRSSCGARRTGGSPPSARRGLRRSASSARAGTST